MVKQSEGVLEIRSCFSLGYIGLSHNLVMMVWRTKLFHRVSQTELIIKSISCEVQCEEDFWKHRQVVVRFLDVREMSR